MPRGLVSSRGLVSYGAEMSIYRKLNSISLAVLDFSDYYKDGLIITRINVPAKYRGQGHGSNMLRELCAKADAEGITLWLEINPYGDMTYEQLEAWYRRYGFKGTGIYKRKPKKG